ncbi:MAG: 50S ribosomal protein L11 methyltransferase, partial [Bacteroidaceae bacterium]|nr:50S ribosomal protein L11 methyltransferase [Bacteroidaceae bacterium]MCF0185999.1 50S ribosomal protein L11 methyltransferase [Bacteroidaceae bacterium]
MEVKNLDVLDMGCGTCILGILAVMRGGKSLTAIDIDEWSIQNSLDNLKLNNIEHAHVLLGDATLLTDRQFDLILANINRNILLNDMNKYVNSLNAHGTLLLSGFYTEDVKLIVAEGERLGLKFIDITSKDNWACVKMIKS